MTISMNPVAFTIGSVSIRWYGVMMALAVLLLVLWGMWKVRKDARLSYETVLTAAIVAVPSAIIFARVIYLLDQLVTADSIGPIIGFEGLTIWGAVLGATLGIWVYSRFSKFPFGYFMDMVAPAAILAQAIGRVGCTINGCCYGIETSLPWGIVYTHPESYAPLNVAVHPTQIYEIIFCLIFFGVLFWLRGRLKPEGSLFLIYLGGYSAWRLGLGFIRDGSPFLFGLHQAQVIGIVVLLIIIPILIMRTRCVKKEGI